MSCHPLARLSAGLAIALSISACARKPETEAPVVVLGVDGFDWSVILPLVAEGRMPHLASLVERGVSGVLESQLPSRSPRLWTTIATGRQPDEHGILDFVRPEVDAETGRPLAYTSTDRRVKAFWNLLSDHGVSNTTLGWWMTHPVEPVLGSMVAQTNIVKNGLKKGTFDPRAGEQVWPPEDEERLREVLNEQYATLQERMLDVFGEFPFELTAAERRRWQQCQWSFRADGLYVAAQEDLLARGRGSRVTAVYLGGTDVVGHRFWAAYRPRDFELAEDGREARAFGHVIPAYYAWVDRVLGQMLESYPPDTTFLIVSDHGMSSRPLETMGENFVEEHTGSHNHGLVSGAFIAAGPGIRVAPPPNRSRHSTRATCRVWAASSTSARRSWRWWTCPTESA